MSIPISQFLLPPTSPLVSIHLFSMSVCEKPSWISQMCPLRLQRQLRKSWHLKGTRSPQGLTWWPFCRWGEGVPKKGRDPLRATQQETRVNSLDSLFRALSTTTGCHSSVGHGSTAKRKPEGIFLFLLLFSHWFCSVLFFLFVFMCLRFFCFLQKIFKDLFFDVDHFLKSLLNLLHLLLFYVLVFLAPRHVGS